MSALDRRRRRLLAPVLTLTLGVAVVLLARWGPDWPAQEFRAWVAAHDGLSAWTSRWYGGEALPGYSVLYPILAGTFGAGPVGVAAVAVAAWATSSLEPRGVTRGRLFAIAVAVSLAQSLLIGQVPFLLGVAFGLLSLRMVLGPTRALRVGLCAALCSLSSPLAGACLLLTLPALIMLRGWRRCAPLLTATLGLAIALVVGGANGPFSFPLPTLAAVLAFGLITLVLTPADNRALRCFVLCYLVVAVGLFLIPNGIGGNAARLGKLIAIPLAVRFIDVPSGSLRRVVSAVAVVLAAAWPSTAFVSSIARGAPDPSQNGGYYRGLTAFLRTQNATTGRLEIPFTREHWESLWVAQNFPIARGWERQADMLYNQALYQPLTAPQYRRWLDNNAVSLVALPDAPIDYGGRAEQTLLTHPPAYLHEVWHDRHWRVWRVSHAQPLVRGDATTSSITAAAITLRFADEGDAVVRIHASRLWQVTAGDGCVGATTEGWLRVHADRLGTITMRARLNRQLVTGTDECRS